MVITLKMLNALIDERYLLRGQEYFEEGMIELLTITPSKITARALGSRVYQVILEQKDSALQGECSCPAFTNFGPCKHMAATGFALIKHNKVGYRPSEQYNEQVEDLNELKKELKKLLAKKSKSELIDLVVDLAHGYPEVAEELDGTLQSN